MSTPKLVYFSSMRRRGVSTRACSIIPKYSAISTKS